MTDDTQVLVEVWHMVGEFCFLLLASALTGMVNGKAGALPEGSVAWALGLPLVGGILDTFPLMARFNPFPVSSSHFRAWLTEKDSPKDPHPRCGPGLPQVLRLLTSSLQNSVVSIVLPMGS